MFQMQKKKLPSVCQTNCYQSFGFRFGKSLQILLFEAFLRMKGEVMFNNTLTIVISHHCIFTKALPRPIHRGFRLLSPLPRLRFSSHCGEFAAITLGKDEVLPRANGPIVSPAKINYICLTEINSSYYGLSLLRTLIRGPEGVHNKGS